MPLNGFHNHSHGVIEAFESHVFRWRSRVIEFAEFAWAVADVARAPNLCTDVVIQVAGKVQNEVSETVPEEEGLFPELSIGKGRGELTDPGGVRGIAIDENRGQRRVQVGHIMPALHAADRQGQLSPHQFLHHAGCFLLQLLGLVVRGEGFDQWLKLAIHHRFKLMKSESDAVVGDTILREVISADLLAAVTRTHHCLALFGQRLLRFSISIS